MMLHKSAYKLSIRLAIIVVIASLTSLACARILWVNQHSPQQITEYYKLNEWVHLDSSFIDVPEESTQGYSIRVIGAFPISPKQYVNEHGLKTNVFEHDLSDLPLFTTFDTERNALVLIIQIANQNNHHGFLNVANWTIIPSAHPSAQLKCDFNLWAETEPHLNDSSAIMTRTNSEYTIKIPFVNERPADVFEYSLNTHAAIIKPGQYALTITNTPIRKTINFSI